MRPTLYDILGVPPTASRDEIRSAWREAVDRFEPGTGPSSAQSSAQFRMFNEAAEVLLDTRRREEYDAEIGAVQQKPAQPAPTDHPTAAPEPAGGPDHGRRDELDHLGAEKPDSPTLEPEPGETGGRPSYLRRWFRDARSARSSTTGPASSTEPASTTGPTSTTSRRAVPVWVLLVLGLLTGGVLGVVIWLGQDYTQASAYQESLEQAPQAAERAAAAVLAYDYRRLEADRDAAAKFLTPRYREEYVNTFDKLVNDGLALQTKTRVEAEVLATSAMVGTERDPDRVQVLVFVDQIVTNANSAQPKVQLNRAQFNMQNVDGTWLVDDVTSY